MINYKDGGLGHKDAVSLLFDDVTGLECYLCKGLNR